MQQPRARSRFLQRVQMKTIRSSRIGVRPHREPMRLCRSFTTSRRRRAAGATAQRRLKDGARDYQRPSVRVWRLCTGRLGLGEHYQSKATFVVLSDLFKAETQALTSYGSGEDENEEEEMEEFKAGPVDVQTSLQASADGQLEQEVGGAPASALLNILTLKSGSVCFRGRRATTPAR